MKYDFVKNHIDLYKVSQSDLEDVENELEIIFPNELRVFLLQQGCGFIKGGGGFNRIMHPFSIRDIRLKADFYGNVSEIENYDRFQKDKLIFFEADESCFIMIELGKKKNNAIYYYDFKIAESLEEFLRKMIENDEYYLDLCDS